MKKFILMAVLVLSTAFTAYAGTNDDVDRKTQPVNAEVYNINVNINSLARFLDLTNKQAVEVEKIQDVFTEQIRNAGYMEDSKYRLNLIKNALNYNLKHMHMWLDEEQYKKYVKVLNITFYYRGIEWV